MLTGMTGAIGSPRAMGDRGDLRARGRRARPMIGMVHRKAEKRIIDTALKGLKRRVEA